jgi:hypothetical protein
MGVEEREEVTRTQDGERWLPVLGDEQSVGKMKALFFENKTHPQVPDSKSLAPEVKDIKQAVCRYYRLEEYELLKSRRGLAGGISNGGGFVGCNSRVRTRKCEIL